MVTFGGEDLHTLFVTTAREGRSAQELATWPDSGAVFATGKSVTIDGDDVDIKTTFTCEVE